MPVSENEMTNPHEEREGTTMSEDIRVCRSMTQRLLMLLRKVFSIHVTPLKGGLLAMQNCSLYLDMVNVVPVGHFGKNIGGPGELKSHFWLRVRRTPLV